MNNYRKTSGFAAGFINAFKGIGYAFKTERNLRFHFFAAGLAVVCGWIFSLSRTEWLIIVYAIGVVIAAELFNTALERLADVSAPGYHPLVGTAKDVAAGAVLVTAFQAVVIGLIVFGPHFLDLVRQVI